VSLEAQEFSRAILELFKKRLLKLLLINGKKL
jgi:hypothetical protein